MAGTSLEGAADHEDHGGDHSEGGGPEPEPAATDHRTGDEQARENADKEPAG